jgi:ATP phosphoribosyltransferase
MSRLIFAIPSKGRLKEQVEAWLGDCGLALQSGGARGYQAGLDRSPEIEVRLLSAGDIAQALDAGDAHLGVTGEDLLRERAEAVGAGVLLLHPLGFGRADLVVAAPKSWLDVETMADLEEVAHDYLLRTGQRMRVATKYVAQTRAFFARHGVADYRIVESGGATEGAPAQGAAELIVDITTSGATLAANGLRPLADGLILESQAQLAASLTAGWSASQRAQAERLVRIVEARSRARGVGLLAWPAEQDLAADPVIAPYLTAGASRRANGLLLSERRLFEAALALEAAGIGPVSASRPEFIFESASPGEQQLRAALDAITV